MVKLTMRHSGDSQTAEFSTVYAAHHALLRGAVSYGFDVTHDIDTIRGTMSGELRKGRADGSSYNAGSWIISG